jgi:hypothetical protein
MSCLYTMYENIKNELPAEYFDKSKIVLKKYYSNSFDKFFFL